MILAGYAATGLLALQFTLLALGLFDAGVTQTIILSIVAIITGTSIAVTARKTKENLAGIKNGSKEVK